METLDGRIKIPFGMVLYGVPMSGKSTFIKNLIDQRDRILDGKIDYIVYFYGERTKTIMNLERENNKDIILVSGMPDDLSEYIDINNLKKPLFIFDDLMDEIVGSKQMVALVSKKCQHLSISWLITFQDAFRQGPDRLSITRAAQYIVLFNSPLDKSVPHILASRIMPENRKAFLDIFTEAVSTPYSYLFCDGHQNTPDRLRLRTHLFGEYQIVFTPRNGKS